MSFRYYKGKKEGSDWCLHGPLVELEAAQGTTVTLTTAKGATKTELCGPIVARFDDGNGLAKIVRESKGAQPVATCKTCGADPTAEPVRTALHAAGDLPF